MVFGTSLASAANRDSPNRTFDPMVKIEAHRWANPIIGNSEAHFGKTEVGPPTENGVFQKLQPDARAQGVAE
jgi:hypothetical protein